MKPEEVTDAMVYAFTEVADYTWLDKEIIAAAWNAVVSDDEPITAEALVKMGYVNGYGPIYHGPGNGGVQISWNGEEVVLTSRILALYLPAKTIGHLRALHAGLGIGVVS